MWTGSGSSRCSLMSFLLAFVFLVLSDSRAAPNGDGSSAYGSAAFAASSAGAFAGAFAGGTGNFPGNQDGHKEIRSYDSTGFSHDNDGRGAKSYGTPPVHGADHDHGIKDGGHDYNRNGDGCSKCKWENDDYWERDEPEEEPNEDECDDGDDGQYRPDKTHHHDASGPGRGHAPVPHPHQSGVYKQGPTDVYGDVNQAGVKGGRPGGANYPSSGGHAGPSGGGFGATTPKPGSRWDSPFASKPGYSSATAGVFGTTPSSWPSWNAGTTPGFGSSPKPGTDNWNTGPGRKPGQGWDTGLGGTPTTGFPSTQKPVPAWNTHDNKFGGNVGTTPIPGSNWNTGFGGSTPAVGLPSYSRKPGAPWPGHGAGSFGTTPRPGQNPWNPNYDQAAPVSQSGCTRSDSSCNQGKQVPVKLGATPIDPTKSDPYPNNGFPTSHTGSDVPSDSYGSSQQDQYGPYGHPGTQSTSGVYAGAGVTSGIGSVPHGRVPDFGKKDHPFGFDKPTYSQVPHDNRPNTGSATYGPGSSPDYNKPGYGSGSHNTWPSNVPSAFGTTKGPYEGINTPPSVPGTQGVTKPSYATTYSWSTPGQIGSGSGSWYGPASTGPHAGFPTSNTRFPTSKTPFGYGSTSAPGNPYAGTGQRQPGFNIASSGAVANAGASASATSFVFGTPLHGTTLAHGRDSSYPGVKGSGNIRPTSGTTPYGTHPNVGNAWPGKGPDTGSGTSPSRYPETVGSTWPARQPGSSNEPGEKPESGVAPGRYPGSWPGKKPGSASGPTSDGHPGVTDSSWPARQPGSGAWDTEKPASVTSDRYPGAWPIAGKPGSVSGSTPDYFGTASGNRPVDGSKTWPDNQSKYGSGSGCSSGTCGGSSGPVGGSNCASGSYNCGSGCNDGNYSPGHGPCGGMAGPSGVNKTYYPAGTGDGSVPNLGSTYGRPNSPVNVGTYPGAGCASGDSSCDQVGGTNTIPEEPVKWNPANPFLFGPGGGRPSDVSRPWASGTTAKPLGRGNPFFDSNWSTPKPGYNTNDQNAIPPGQDNSKPSGQGNPFLDGNKRRGDIDVNANEGVIPLGGRKPEGSNPFIGPGSGSDGPSYSGHPVGSPGSGTPASGSYGSANDGFQPGGSSPQGGSNAGPYSTGGTPPGSPQCKLGIFGCGTPGSGSYAPAKGGKHPGGSFGGIGSGISGSTASVFGGSAHPGAAIDSGTGPVPGQFGARHPGSAGNNAGAYAGSFSGAQAASSNAAGSGNNFGQSYGGSWSSSGAQNQGGSNPWASSGASASAFASSSAGSWSGNHPTNVKG